ncbi:MAG: DUF899 domain-containing protein [Acidimicrobiales bacterium]
MSPSTSSQGHSVVDRETWTAARLEHLEREKKFTRERDALSSDRRGMPWLEITEDYRFDTPGGSASLRELFDGRGQLLVYHFMLGPGWPEGCPSCSFWADNYDGTQIHLAHRDTTLVTVSRAPLAEIEAYKQRMGWTFGWVSSHDAGFNYDLGVSFTPQQLESNAPNYNFDTQAFPGEEAAGLSAFTCDADGRVFLTYQTFSRGLDMVNGAYQMLDLTAAGRNETELDWSMQWLHRHDAYPVS